MLRPQMQQVLERRERVFCEKNKKKIKQIMSACHNFLKIPDLSIHDHGEHLSLLIVST